MPVSESKSTTVAAVLNLRDPVALSVVDRLPLKRCDFQRCCLEFLRDQYLRQGEVVGLDELELVVCASRRTAQDAGFAIDGRLAGEASWRRMEFSSRALQERANEFLRQLIEAGRIPEDAALVIDLLVEQPVPLQAPKSPAAGTRRPVFHYPINKLLAGARLQNAGAADGADFPVFYLAHALQRAEAYARGGYQCRPPIETGCMLLGYLCSSSLDGEYYAVVTDAIQIQKAAASTYELAFSGDSWSRIESHLRRVEAHGIRLLGQGHGHPFLPGETCETCSRRAVCTLHSAGLSRDDRLFAQGAFHSMCSQLNHIWGLNARGEGAEALYTLRDGHLQSRPYFVVDQLPDGLESEAEKSTHEK